MKISAVKSYPIQGDGNARYFIVKVETDEGIHGLGEAGIQFWAGAIRQAVEHLSELLIGQDPFSTEKLWQHMFRGMFFPADRVYACAMSAIDIALWDIKGKALGLPVYKLLGGPVRDKVVCYPHNQESDPMALAEESVGFKEMGWKFLRWGLPETGDGLLEPVESMRLAVKQMEAVRNAVGPDMQLLLDVHTRLDTAHAATLCGMLEPYRPFFIEDPLRSENPASYRTLAARVNLPIAAGEQWATKWQFREAIEDESISYARIDLCVVGGITEALKITHWCETHYIDIVPHNPLGPVSAAACVALCMATTNVGVQEMPRRPGTYAADLFPVQVEWEDGYAFAPERPGLGVEMDEELAASRPGQPTGWAPLLRRNDGAFTNW